MDWNEHAPSWDNAATRAYADAAFSSLRRVTDTSDRPLAGARVLDFGCGTGLLTERMATLAGEIVAIDPAPQMIQVLRRKLEAKAFPHVACEACTLDDALERQPPHFSAPFDLITCSSVCAFLDDYPATVRRLAACLAPGGLFVQWDWARASATPSDEPDFGLTTDEIRNALEAAELDVWSVSTAFRIDVDGQTMAPLMGVGRRPAAPDAPHP